MKNLMLLVLLLPLGATGQLFDVAVLEGCSMITPSSYFVHGNTNNDNPVAVSSQESVNLHLSKLFSFGAYHEITCSRPGLNTVGALADIHYMHVYFGVSAGELIPGSKTVTLPSGDNFPGANQTIVASPVQITYRINPAVALGTHLGWEYEMNEHWTCKGQLQYYTATSRGELLGVNYKVIFRSISAFTGLSYRL